MDANNTLKRLFVGMLQETFKESESYSDFKVAIVSKEIKSKFGRYTPNDRMIEVFNLSRKSTSVLITGIHELAHHVEFMETGEKTHKKSFYSYYHQLLLTGLRLGLISVEDLKYSATDSPDLSKLEEWYGDIDSWKFSKKRDSEAYIVVFNCFNEKDDLKQRGYTYFPHNKSWRKKFQNVQEAEKERKLLLFTLHLNELNIKLGDLSTALFTQQYTLAVHGAFSKKETLSKLGYGWEIFNVKKAWVKRIFADQYEEEVRNLKEARLTFKNLKV
ncbi:hypothetical protein [Enterococcus sp. AZ163]|uniref:hypothetical protein n=1 Tax=Enterococcus sp. AZ163 TaxID=2774638 RepID=UPI003D27AF12